MFTRNRPIAISVWVVAVVLVCFAVRSGMEVSADLQAKSWPTAAGRVVSQDECYPTIKCGLKYEYTIGAEKYLGTRIAHTRTHLPKKWTEAEIQAWSRERYPVGSEVQVSYHPRSPHRSSLQVGVYSRDAFGGPAIMGFAALVVAGYGWLRWRGLIRET